MGYWRIILKMFSWIWFRHKKRSVAPIIMNIDHTFTQNSAQKILWTISKYTHGNIAPNNWNIALQLMRSRENLCKYPLGQMSIIRDSCSVRQMHLLRSSRLIRPEIDERWKVSCLYRSECAVVFFLFCYMHHSRVAKTIASQSCNIVFGDAEKQSNRQSKTKKNTSAPQTKTEQMMLMQMQT